jgi:hypothetical protein
MGTVREDLAMDRSPLRLALGAALGAAALLAAPEQLEAG